MNISQQIITVGMVVLGTVITRFLPFIIFPPNRSLPKFINYLGRVLTPAAMGMLVVYCFRNVEVFSGTHGIPELISLTAVIVIHTLKRQMLLSIAVGTVLYMLLVQVIF